MEQATNLFTKGLLMDTHPMVLSNDTLTDCLNGTLITMNGNEVILLNDMGNRRVDKAFLPPGYEPVGMKEYGGIIYVAAYNPITNKSLIGSFPSPLKKLSSTNNKNLEETFDFDSFFSNNNVESDSNLNINIIKSDSFIIPLSNDINLRAGDKFAVYSERLSTDFLENLTNYNNINLSGTKAFSPKNKKYTLLLGVLNSLNEFVDITKTLCRWKEIDGTWSPINYDEEKSDIFKFNDGYFISDSFTTEFNEETINDAELIKERLKIAANTYSYKLVGPLYLKCILNHIENFNYNIYGTYDKNTSKATLWIEGFLTYNCPDGVNTLGNNSNENYETFSEGEPSDNFGFDLYSLSNNRVTKLTPTSYIKESCIYNPNTNTYTVKLVKKFTNISATSGNIFNYVIGVKADNDTEEIYLKGLSIKGSIDLSLLGSGELKINGWRFYNTYKKEENDGSSILTFSFNAYPEYGKSFDYLRFKFLEIPSNDSGFYYPSGYLPLYNGRQTIKFNWKENGFNPRKVYKVTVYYREVDNKTKVISPEQEIDEGRWFLTTELFNEFYEVSANTEDYCKVPNDGTRSDFYDKMIVNIGKTSNITNNSIITSKKVEETSLLSLSENILYKYENTYNLNLKIDAKLIIYNENLYPDYIKVVSSDSFKIHKIAVTKIGDTITNNILFPGLSSYNYSDQSLKDLIPCIYGSGVTLGDTTNTTEYKFKDNIKCLISITSNGKSTVNGTLKYYDIYAGKGESIIGIDNAFCNFKDFLREGNSLPKAGEYGGVVVNYYASGSRQHYIDVATKQLEKTISLPPDNTVPEDWYEVEQLSSLVGYISKFAGEIFLYLNIGVENTSNAFIYVFYGHDGWFATKIGSDSNLNNLDGSPKWTENQNPYKTRLWWKMPNGEWAVFKNLLEESSDQNLTIALFVINALGKDIIYCMYDYYDGNSNIYTAVDDYIYSNKYSIPATIKIIYLLDTGGLSNLAFLNRAISFGPYGQSAVPCGNLCFQRNSSLEFLSNDDYLDIELKSSDKFLDDVIKFDPSNISNVYINTGQMVDSNGDKLNPNQIYFINDQGKLERILNNPLYVDNINKVNGKNRLLYNKTNKGALVLYNVQLAEKENDSDTKTFLVYDKINLVESI